MHASQRLPLVSCAEAIIRGYAPTESGPLVRLYHLGYFARKVHSLPLGLLFGVAVGALLAYGVVAMQVAQGGKAYYLPIMLPGAALGLIVGYATQRHAERSSQATAGQ
jgi:hypothetical protein